MTIQAIQDSDFKALLLALWQSTSGIAENLGVSAGTVSKAFNKGAGMAYLKKTFFSMPVPSTDCWAAYINIKEKQRLAQEEAALKIFHLAEAITELKQPQRNAKRA